MERKATFALAEVRTAATDSANGEFEMVMSTDSVDRDGESIVKGAFNPLPESIPVHAFHDFNDPIGRVVPEYDANGRLVGKGYFASTARAQEIRQLVADGVIGHSSVGFMAAERTKSADGKAPEVTSAELLEVSFVSVPSNRDAAVLMVKHLDEDAKAGARNSAKDAERLQTIHDYAVENGAACADAEKAVRPSKIVRKAHGMTANALRERLATALRAVYGDDETWTWIRDYSDEWVVVEVESGDDVRLLRVTYTVNDGAVSLSSDAQEVVATISYDPAPQSSATPAPEAPSSDEDGKSPASTVVEMARLMARHAQSSVTD